MDIVRNPEEGEKEKIERKKVGGERKEWKKRG